MIECHLNVPQGRRWPEWRGHTEFNANQVAVTPGLRKANVRVEQRLDGSMAVRHGEGVLAPLRPPPPDSCQMAIWSGAEPCLAVSTMNTGWKKARVTMGQNFRGPQRESRGRACYAAIP
jgi:hypothetical protein